MDLTDKGNVSLHLSQLSIETSLRTTHHRVVIYRHPHLGRVLLLDDEIQHVEAWAPLYHEPLVHLPAAFVEEPQSALLLGGGSLFAAKELLKYPSIGRILMLDHDPELIQTICNTYEHARSVCRSPRVEIKCADAFKSLSKIREKFDLVINDSVDLFSLRTQSAFQDMARVLSPEGVCADVVYRHVFDDIHLNQTLELLRGKYRTAFSLIFVPEYPGVLHLLTLWSINRRVSQKQRTTRNRQQQRWSVRPWENPCDYFDARFLPYYLHLPRYIRQLAQEEVLQKRPFKT